MRVTCMTTSGSSLPLSSLDELAGITRETEFALTIGAVYVVYAITTFHGHCWYYVFDDDLQPYPVWNLASLFEIPDPSLPRDWVVGYVRKGADDEGCPLISFPEWASDHLFYERLVDGDGDAVAVFEARRVSAEGEVGDSG